jgi:hypothetical protein
MVSVAELSGVFFSNAPRPVQRCADERPSQSAAGSARPYQPGTIEVGSHLVERRARDAELRNGISDGLPLGADAAEHLVAHLHQVVRIEEVAMGEGEVQHSTRMGIDGPVLVERLAFRRGLNPGLHM